MSSATEPSAPLYIVCFSPAQICAQFQKSVAQRHRSYDSEALLLTHAAFLAAPRTDSRPPALYPYSALIAVRQDNSLPQRLCAQKERWPDTIFSRPLPIEEGFLLEDCQGRLTDAGRAHLAVLRATPFPHEPEILAPHDRLPTYGRDWESGRFAFDMPLAPPHRTLHKGNNLRASREIGRYYGLFFLKACYATALSH